MLILIFLAGLMIYAGYGLAGAAWLLASAVISYTVGLLLPKYPKLLWPSVGLSALILILVKLQPVTGMSWAAPMGISYFMLRLISYQADIYKGRLTPEKNFLRYGLYVTYLPNLFLGPIERYDKFCRDAFVYRRITWDGISGGAIRLLWGLFKKLVIAARAGVIVGAISADPDRYSGAYAFFAMVMYSLQLYADFSGGIDMVLGVSAMLGIFQSENFRTPYFSQTVAEFWRRWHITLGAWLREYVYIPLGGSRRGKLRKAVNTLVTFTVSGLWHGIHYVLWGLFNGIFVFLGDRLKTPWKLGNQLLTFLIISLLWSFFVWPDTGTALKMMGSVVTVWNWGDLAANFFQLGLNGGEWLVLAVAAALLWLCDWKKQKISNFLGAAGPALRVAIVCTLGLVILIFGMYGIGFNAEAFIYSKF